MNNKSCVEINNSTSQDVEFKYEEQLYYGETYNFSIKSIACEGGCNEESEIFENKTGLVLKILYF